MKKYLPIAVLIVLSACAATAPKTVLLKGAENIKVFRNDDPPITCKELNTIVVSHGNNCGAFGAKGNFNDAYKLFKNEVVSNNGNAALLQSETPPHNAPNCYVNEYTIRGIVYSCPTDVFEN